MNIYLITVISFITFIILFVFVYIVGSIIFTGKSQNKEYDDVVADNLEPISTNTSFISSKKEKYGIIQVVKNSKVSVDDKCKIAFSLLDAIAIKVDQLYKSGILTDNNIATLIRDCKNKPYTISYIVYVCIIYKSIIPKIDQSKNYAINNKFLSFMVINDMFMNNVFYSTGDVHKVITLTNFKFSTRGFEDIYNQLKNVLNRVKTEPVTTNNLRISSSLSRYIDLTFEEQVRIPLERHIEDVYNVRNVVPQKEIHLLEILGLSFLIDYLEKYLDMLNELEYNVDIKRGYSQLLLKYNLTIH